MTVGELNCHRNIGFGLDRCLANSQFVNFLILLLFIALFILLGKR